MGTPQGRHGGFSLLELLLALALGITLAAAVGDALLGELRHSGRLARLLRERAVSERALALMRSELEQAEQVQVMPAGPLERDGCALERRKVLLHLIFSRDGGSPDRNVTYALEPKPHAIWRGQTLMRCGPSYGLDGQLLSSAPVSRVWLDGLAENGFTLRADGDAVTAEMRRVFQEASGAVHAIEQRMRFPLRR